MHLAVNPDEDLVQIPFVAGLGASGPKTACEGRAELQTPSPDALLGDDDAALRQDQFNVAEA
jgi:hypothetical protein